MEYWVMGRGPQAVNSLLKQRIQYCNTPLLQSPSNPPTLHYSNVEVVAAAGSAVGIHTSM